MSSESHCFALHVTALSAQLLAKKDYVRIADQALMHRIKQVLRLHVGDRVILFDSSQYAHVLIHNISSQELEFQLEEVKTIPVLNPFVTWWLPLLKKEAFEEALYVLAALGVQSIQPVRTRKATRAWGSPKDYVRAESIMIAACEQAKQFSLPELKPVKELRDCAAQSDALKILFDPAGEKLTSVLSQQYEKSVSIVACTGPEGDFVAEEKRFLKHQGFTSCSLTTMILKAEHAITVGMGIIRSW